MYRTVKIDPWFDHQPEKRFLDELTAQPEEELTVPPLPDREPWMKTRITRCFFSPINRPPKNGDELSDDVDYYPENYLRRLQRDGTNGVWIYTRFSDLVRSSYLPDYGADSEKRIAKLNRVIEKCGRFGIKVYVFAIEPVALTEAQSALLPEADGGPAGGGKRLFCVNTEKGKAFCEELGERLFTLCPGLGGLISITYGERPTSCSSAFARLEREWPPVASGRREIACPRCRNLPVGQVIANAAEALRSGVRKVSPEAQVISWTYGARLLPHSVIREYVRDLHSDVVAMQNFEEMGTAVQLGRERLGVDYWLSYAGPSSLFEVTAEEAAMSGKTVFMKTQVCCSHELATLPYVPVPGLLFEKYAKAHALGVTGVMQCWYFGNYPSLMSRAAGLLAWQEDFSESAKDAFLRTLAALTWEQKDVPAVAAAWRSFEAGYRQIPLNIMFSYYGPLHDGVVWELQLEPKNFSLPRSWQTLDPTDGDRIGECLMQGHTPEEALTLVSALCREWDEGLASLRTVTVRTHAQKEQRSVAEAVGILAHSARNILDFYLRRERLGRMESPEAELAALELLVRDEISNSERMIALCEEDGRLGYHSEGEGYKFFPEKLRARIAQLKELLETEFPRVKARIDAGEPPLPYYLGQEPDAKVYVLAEGQLDGAEWERVGNGAFRGAYDEESVRFALRCKAGETILIVPEFRLFCPGVPVRIRDGNVTIDPYDTMYQSLLGDAVYREAARWHAEPTADGVIVTLDRKDIGFTDTRFPFRLRVQIGPALWCAEESPVRTLGKSLCSPLEFGWICAGKGR